MAGTGNGNGSDTDRNSKPPPSSGPGTAGMGMLRDHEERRAVHEVLSLLSGSGYVRVDVLSLVSVQYCNAMRESLGFVLTVKEATPARLKGVLHPRPTGQAEEGPPSRISLPLTIHHLRCVRYQ